MVRETHRYNTLSKTELIEIIKTREAEEEKLYFDCECGIRTTRSHKARHLKSQQHKKFEETRDGTTKREAKEIEKL